MSLFQSLGQDAQRYQMNDGYYKSADEAKWISVTIQPLLQAFSSYVCNT